MFLILFLRKEKTPKNSATKPNEKKNTADCTAEPPIPKMKLKLGNQTIAICTTEDDSITHSGFSSPSKDSTVENMVDRCSIDITQKKNKNYVIFPVSAQDSKEDNNTDCIAIEEENAGESLPTCVESDVIANSSSSSSSNQIVGFDGKEKGASRDNGSDVLVIQQHISPPRKQETTVTDEVSTRRSVRRRSTKSFSDHTTDVSSSSNNEKPKCQRPNRSISPAAQHLPTVKNEKTIKKGADKKVSERRRSAKSVSDHVQSATVTQATVSSKNNTLEQKTERRRSTKSSSEQNTSLTTTQQKGSDSSGKLAATMKTEDDVKGSSTSHSGVGHSVENLQKEQVDKLVKKKNEKTTGKGQRKLSNTKSASEPNSSVTPADIGVVVSKKKVERTSSGGEKSGGGGAKNFEQKYELFKQKWKADKEKRRLMKDTSGNAVAVQESETKLHQEKRPIQCGDAFRPDNSPSLDSLGMPLQGNLKSHDHSSHQEPANIMTQTNILKNPHGDFTSAPKSLLSHSSQEGPIQIANFVSNKELKSPQEDLSIDRNQQPSSKTTKVTGVIEALSPSVLAADEEKPKVKGKSRKTKKPELVVGQSADVSHTSIHQRDTTSLVSTEEDESTFRPRPSATDPSTPTKPVTVHSGKETGFPYRKGTATPVGPSAASKMQRKVYQQQQQQSPQNDLTSSPGKSHRSLTQIAASKIQRKAHEKQKQQQQLFEAQRKNMIDLTGMSLPSSLMPSNVKSQSPLKGQRGPSAKGGSKRKSLDFITGRLKFIKKMEILKSQTEQYEENQSMKAKGGMAKPGLDLLQTVEESVQARYLLGSQSSSPRQDLQARRQRLSPDTKSVQHLPGCRCLGCVQGHRVFVAPSSIHPNEHINQQQLASPNPVFSPQSADQSHLHPLGCQMFTTNAQQQRQQSPSSLLVPTSLTSSHRNVTTSPTVVGSSLQPTNKPATPGLFLRLPYSNPNISLSAGHSKG